MLPEILSFLPLNYRPTTSQCFHQCPAVENGKHFQSGRKFGPKSIHVMRRTCSGGKERQRKTSGQIDTEPLQSENWASLAADSEIRTPGSKIDRYDCRQHLPNQSVFFYNRTLRCFLFVRIENKTLYCHSFISTIELINVSEVSRFTTWIYCVMEMNTIWRVVMVPSYTQYNTTSSRVGHGAVIH